MAETRQNWIQWLAFGALCLNACAAGVAQPNPAGPAPVHSVQVQSPLSGSLAGRLTDLDSAPLAGVSVVLRNVATGAEAHTTTAKNGAFRFASLEAGEYTLEADAAQLGHGRLEGILLTGGIEARVQAAMHFEPAAPTQIAAPSIPAASMPLTASVQPAIASPGTPAAAPAPATLLPPAATSAPLPAPNPAIVAAGPLKIPSKTAPSAPRPALSISSPPFVTSIAAESLRLMPVTALRTADAIPHSAQPTTPAQTPPRFVAQPSAPTQTSPRTHVPALQPATSTAPAPRQAQPESHAPALPQRAALETQSVAMELALVGSLPRPLPLAASGAPGPVAAVPASAVQAALLNPPPVAPSVAAAQPPDPVAPAVTTTVTASQLQALPASGRNWQQFLLDTPAAGASADSSQASFRGSQESAEIAIDGANTRLAFGAAVSASGSQVSDASGDYADRQSSMSQSGSLAWAGGRGLGVNEAAIHEVTTTAGNVEAEGMLSAGGRTTIRTESGANALHGQGFLFDRQNTWGAQNPFTQLVQFTGFATGSTPNFSAQPYTPPDHELVWGLGAGSRIRRDKLFWFAALDSYHRNDPGLATVKHPLDLCGNYNVNGQCTYLAGFFEAPTDPQIQLLSAQLGESFNQAYNDYLGSAVPTPPPPPQPAGPLQPVGLEQLANLLGPAPRTAAQWTGFGRIDWQAAERHRFTLEGIGADWNSPGGGLTQVSEDYGNHSFGSSKASEEWLLARWEAYLTPNLLAVTQGSAGRDILAARPDAPSALEQGFLGSSWNSYGQLPEIVVDSRYGFTIGNPSRFGQGNYPDERLYHGQEMLDWAHNHLLVKAGFELDHNADATSLLRNQTGSYYYSKVENFISDALVFEKFGFADALDEANPHSCDTTGKAWRTTNGQLEGLGAMPCYSHYSQMIGPTNWHLSTNDWAGYATAQWQLNKFAVFSAGLRWEREQLPPPIAALANSDLPLTEKLPDLGNQWSPRFSLAIGNAKSHWPVLRLGYGMYYGRVENATIETALTQTGSLKGDLYFFMRPSDDLQRGSGGAPPFPYVLSAPPGSVVKPGAVEFASNFRNPEVHQAVAAIEQPLPGRVELTAGAMLSLGRRLPVSIDTNVNLDPSAQQTITYYVCDQTPATPSGSTTVNGQCGNLGLGPIKKATQITVPFYASQASTGSAGWLNPDYQEIDQITSKANSTYEAAMVKLARYGSRGLSFHAHYTYAHTMDWNPNESPMDPSEDFRQEYGTSNLDVRHSAAVMLVYEAPWKLRDFAGRFANGWMLSGVGQFHSGLPYTMRVTGSIPTEFEPDKTIIGLRPGMNGSGGDNRVYGLGNDGRYYNIGRNTYRYPNTWKADLRLAKRFDLGESRQLEILAESFNLFNHQNVTEIETTGYTIESGSPPSTTGGSATPPTLNFLTGLKTNPKTGLPTPAFGQPLNINGSDFYRERQIELGLRMRF
ncbi:MAG: carboxypeptidase regulatory-like domain-containing protein [Terracidiphilus sp.]